MRGKKGFVMIIFMMLITVALWGFVWVHQGNITFEWILTMIMFFALIILSMTFFIGKILEKHGYRKKELKKLHVILEEHWTDPWEQGYLLYDVQRSIIYHLLLWGFLGTILLQFKDFSLVLVSFVSIIFMLIEIYPLFATMVAWLLCIPLYLFGNEKSKGLFEFIALSSLVGASGILLIWSIASHLVTIKYPQPVSNMFLTESNLFIVKNLLVLSILNVFFGMSGLYLPQRVGRKQTGAILLMIAMFMLLVVLNLFAR